jgi:hypothetical protein
LVNSIITVTASGQIDTGGKTVRAFYLSPGSAAATAKLHDAVAATNERARLVAQANGITAGGEFHGARFGVGLYVEIVGAGAAVTIEYV